MAHEAFISYASADKLVADAVCTTLEARNTRCWIAPRDVLPGANYGGAIIDAINSSRIFILVFSSSSNASSQVMREVERAASKGIPILPFRIEDVPLSNDMEYFISAPHWLDALTPPLENHLQHLADTVRPLLSRAGNVGQAKQRQPWAETAGKVGLPAGDRERARVAARAQRGAGTERRWPTQMLATLGVALALWGGWRITTGRGAHPLEGAAWRVTEAGIEEQKIRLLSGADGAAMLIRRGGKRCVTPQPGPSLSTHLYFDVDDAPTRDARAPVYAMVEYLDDSPGGGLGLDYDSATGDTAKDKYRYAAWPLDCALLGSKEWKTATFLLEWPRFANRQNLGADFRLTIENRPVVESELRRDGSPLFIRSVRLTYTRPAGWVRAAP
jgi:hypothetical protein